MEQQSNQVSENTNNKSPDEFLQALFVKEKSKEATELLKKNLGNDKPNAALYGLVAICDKAAALAASSTDKKSVKSARVVRGAALDYIHELVVGSRTPWFGGDKARETALEVARSRVDSELNRKSVREGFQAVAVGLGGVTGAIYALKPAST